MKKSVILIALVLCLMSYSLPVYAEDNATYIDQNTNYYVLYDESGSIVKKNMPNYSNIQRTGNHTQISVSSSGSKRNYDSGYHPETQVWRKVSAYNFTTGSSVSITLSFQAGGKTISGSIGVSATASQSFGYTITADQTRYSKIRVYTGFDYVHYRADVIDNTSGNIVYTYYYTTISKTHEEFRVVYE